MHVGIEEPNEKRRYMLNSAIDIIELLKKYQRFKKIRKEKGIRRREFSITMKEIRDLFKEIEEMLPVVEEQQEPKKIKVSVVKKPEPVKEEVVIKKPVVKRDPRMGKLEKDLQALKDRISKI